MTGPELLREVRSWGGEVWANGDGLELAFSDDFPAKLIEDLKQRKTEILAALRCRAIGDGQAPPLDRPPATERELRRLIDHLADPEAFSRWLEWAMTFTDQSEGMPQYGGSKSVKRPSDTGISDHSPAKHDIPDSTVLLTRLRVGQAWLLDQHSRWPDDTTAADDAELTRALNGWWELDHRLRADYGFQGCIYGPDGGCPDGFPCQGCADLAVPGVVAQLELMPHA